MTHFKLVNLFYVFLVKDGFVDANLLGVLDCDIELPFYPWKNSYSFQVVIGFFVPEVVGYSHCVVLVDEEGSPDTGHIFSIFELTDHQEKTVVGVLPHFFRRDILASIYSLLHETLRLVFESFLLLHKICLLIGSQTFKIKVANPSIFYLDNVLLIFSDELTSNSEAVMAD